MVLSILKEIVTNNKQNDRVAILEREKDNNTFKRVLNYGLNPNIIFGIKKVNKATVNTDEITLDEAMDILHDQIILRRVTGDEAYKLVNELLTKLNANDSEVLHRIIQKNLLADIGVKTVNMVYKNFIPETPYMRCDTLKDELVEKITFPALLQVKEDGQFINFVVYESGYQLLSRNGKELLIDTFEETAKKIYNLMGYSLVIMGELLVRDLTTGDILDRQTGNGYIQRDDHTNPNYKIFIKAWDTVPYSDWVAGSYPTNYANRFGKIMDLAKEGLIEQVVTEKVNNVDEAQVMAKEWINQGLEGGILKSFEHGWRNGTCRQTLKIKDVFDVDLKIIDILPGKDFSNCADTLGALVVESSDGKVTCKVGTGFTQEQRDHIYNNKEKYIGKIVTIIANKLTKDNSLYLPRFIEIREDKDVADNYNKIRINSKGKNK